MCVRSLATAVFSVVAIWSFESRACSVCEPGDPLFSGEGASAQPAGSLAFYLDARHAWKRSGALPHHDDDHEHESEGRDDEENYTRETWLFASWTPLERLTLTAAVPHRWITIEEQPHAEPDQRLRNSGFGDAQLFATAILWRNREHVPSTWLEGRLMLKLPTGQRDARTDGKLDPHAQLGTGSWDWGVGLAATHRFIEGSIYGSVFFRFNSEGALDYEYGDVLLANVAFTSDALRYSMDSGQSELRGGAELNFRYAGKDDFRRRSYDDSGGSILYVTPFVELRLGSLTSGHAPWLRLSMRIPLGSGGLHGRQREGFVYSAGLRLSF